MRKNEEGENVETTVYRFDEKEDNSAFIAGIRR